MTLTFTDPASLSPVERDEGAVFAPRFDAHGLLSAIAVDATDGQVLMLGHMNAEALSRTIESGEVHYYSRSRNRIWKKGETSGEIQRVVEILADCDQDALVIRVEQQGHGAACHTGRHTCFFRRVVDGARLEDTGLPRLFDPAKVYATGQ